MYRRIYTLLEMANIICCLHFLYRKKPRMNLETVLLVCADALIFEFITGYHVNPATIVLLYLLVFIYTIIEFGCSMKDAVISNMMYFLILGISQLLSNFPLLILGIGIRPDDWLGVYVNIFCFFVIFSTRTVLPELFTLVRKKQGASILVLVIFSALVAHTALEYKQYWKMSAEEFLMITVFGCLVFLLSYCWQTEREKARIREIELHLHNLYDASFKEMINAMQERQHDFHNHIQAIRALHYTVHTYEELVKEQEQYCEDIIKDNRFFRLLNSGSPVLTGFLYGKFTEAGKMGIEIEYSVNIKDPVTELPEYILIEIIGILWDNAAEAVRGQEEKSIAINLSKKEAPLFLEVGNPVINNISYEEIKHCFERGQSSKADHAGIGLYKVSRYSEQFGYHLIADKRKRNGREWLYFRISFEAVHTGK